MSNLAEITRSVYSGRTAYIERLIDERAGISTVNGRIAPSIVDELTGFLSDDYGYGADDAREKVLREKYGLAD